MQTLDKVTVPIREGGAGLRKGSSRYSDGRTVSNFNQLIVAGSFHSILPGCSRPQVTESAESETAGKGTMVCVRHGHLQEVSLETLVLPRRLCASVLCFRVCDGERHSTWLRMVVHAV